MPRGNKCGMLTNIGRRKYKYKFYGFTLNIKYKARTNILPKLTLLLLKNLYTGCS